MSIGSNDNGKKVTQLEWLMLHLEPVEALELRACCDWMMSRGWPHTAECPVCWLDESVAADATISGHLANGFIWANSPQGKEYWQAVYDKYKAMGK